MKKKFLLISAAIILLAGSVNAQSKVQLRAGVNFANVSITENGRVDEAKMLTSFHAGIIGDLSVANVFSIQPGILFTGKGSKTQAGNTSGTSYYKATTNPYYIEIPLNLVLKAPIGNNSRFFVGAGPYLAVGIAGKNKAEGQYLGIGFNRERDIEFSDDDPSTLNFEEGAGFGIMRRFDYGLNGVAGIEGKAVVLGVNYGLGLAKLQSGTNSAADNDNKHRVLSISLGFKL